VEGVRDGGGQDDVKQRDVDQHGFDELEYREQPGSSTHGHPSQLSINMVGWRHLKLI
jgi:hypothetical protein